MDPTMSMAPPESSLKWFLVGDYGGTMQPAVCLATADEIRGKTCPMRAAHQYAASDFQGVLV